MKMIADFEDKFLSEVHIDTCPPGEGVWTTDFRVFDHGERDDANASKNIAWDEDGDLDVPRRANYSVWMVRHFRKTTLDNVGMQVRAE